MCPCGAFFSMLCELVIALNTLFGKVGTYFYLVRMKDMFFCVIMGLSALRHGIQISMEPFWLATQRDPQNSEVLQHVILAKKRYKRRLRGAAPILYIIRVRKTGRLDAIWRLAQLLWRQGKNQGRHPRVLRRAGV